MDLRIYIAMPSGGQIKAATVASLVAMVRDFTSAKYEGGKKEVLFGTVTGSILPDVRSRLVAEAMRADATHLLWVDSDMKFPADALRRLLAHGLPVVAANYPTRAFPTGTVGYTEGDDYIGPLHTRKDDTGLVEVTHVGMGLMLTDMRVYELVDLPYFQFEPIPPHNIRMIGEDVWFCRRLREKGLKVMVDQDLSQEVEHIGDWHYTHAQANECQRVQASINIPGALNA